MSPWLSVIYLNTSLGFYPTTLVCFCYCNKDPMAALLYQEWVTQTTVTEAVEHGSGQKSSDEDPMASEISGRAHVGKTSFFARQKVRKYGGQTIPSEDTPTVTSGLSTWLHPQNTLHLPEIYVQSCDGFLP